jgi:AraC-like DNA-binding protein
LLNQPEASRHAAALAAVLGLSVRTLHRQLREEGTSLQSLKDEVRQDQACEWLQRSDMPIKQIAEKVGFRNEKSFIRAFKAWTGQSPAAWRQAR